MPRERNSVKLVGVRQTGNCECSLRPVTLLRRFDRGIAPRRVRGPSRPRVCHFPSLKAPSPRWETPRQGRRWPPRRCLDEPPRHVSDLTVRAKSETDSPGRGSLRASLLGPVSTPRSFGPAAQDASCAQRLTRLPVAWTDVMFPSASKVAPTRPPFKYQIPGSPVMGLERNGP